MLKTRTKNKLAALGSIETPAGYLAPKGRAPQHLHVEEAHSCGEFLANANARLLGCPPEGEVATALVTGALSVGGNVTLYQNDGDNLLIPEGAAVQNFSQDCQNRVLSGIGHIWVMPPALADLEYYLQTWKASGFLPLVCLSPRDEFLLLRGFVNDIVSAGKPKVAKRLIFAKTPEEGWEKLSELLG